MTPSSDDAADIFLAERGDWLAGFRLRRDDFAPDDLRERGTRGRDDFFACLDFSKATAAFLELKALRFRFPSSYHDANHLP